MKVPAALAVTLAVVPALVAGQQPVPSHASARPPAREVVRVNDVPLMSDRLDVAVNALIPMESFHRNVSAATLASLRKKALDTLVDEELAYQDGVRHAIKVSDAEVNAEIARVTGRYQTRQALDQALRRAGASRADLRREIRRSLTIRKAYAHAVTSRCQVTRAEAAVYFKANPDRFVEPERVHLFTITVGVDPTSGAQKWTEARARAEDVRRQITDGAPFEDMARKYSTDSSAKKGGDMGFVHRGSLAETFEKVASQLQPGQVSEIVETLYGYHIVRVSEIRAPQRKSFAEVGSKLRGELATQRCTELGDRWRSTLRAGATVVPAE
jgi:peptidyl-prolyl cis-trans isomerase C